MRQHSYFTLYLLAVSSLMVVLLFSATSRAYGAEVIVVNVKKVLSESKAATSIRNQVQDKQKSFQKELNAREKALQKENQELAKQRSLLSKEEYEKKIMAFRTKASNAQKQIRDKRVNLDKAFSSALGEIQRTIAKIASDIAKEKDVPVVISSSQLIYADTKLDITDDVISQLNKQKPKVDVAF